MGFSLDSDENSIHNTCDDVKPMKPLQISFPNGTEIELKTRGEEFLGIGEVHVGEHLLRDGSRPMFVEIRNPSARSLSNYRLADIDRAEDQVTLRFAMDAEQSGQMEWMLHTVRNRYAATDWSEAPAKAADTTLELILRPVERLFRGHRFVGFSYQYRYASESIPIYKILDRGTWEPDGTVVGKSFWMRNGITASITDFTDVAEKYSTEWYLPPIEQPNIFQFFPLQMALQGFTYTTGTSGTLLTWPTEVAHVRSLFEKHPGKAAMFHWHEHCGDLANDFKTSPVEVLWCAHAPGTHTDNVNRYEAVRGDIWTELHQQVGLRYETIEPYGVIEEWTLPDFGMYREKALPALASKGAKTIFLPNQFENNMNVWGLSNMCCNVDFKVAERVGPEKFKAFCHSAGESGIRVEMWGNTAVSTLTDMFRRKEGGGDRIQFLPSKNSIEEVLNAAKHPFVRNASGAIEADHYTPVFCALNLREPKIRDYWMECWTALRRDYGVGQIFVDSSFNMSGDKFTHRQNDHRARAGGATLDQADQLGTTRPDHEVPAAIESQYHAYLSILVEMQKAGYVVCGEDVGLFGLSRSGPDLADRIDSLPLWLDSYCDFDAGVAEARGFDPQLIFVKGLAYRVMWKIYFDVPTEELTFRINGAKSDADRPTEWHAERFRAYSLALPLMQVRTVLPDEQGVRYDSEEGSIVWAFRPFELPLGAQSRVTDLATGASWETSALEAKPNQVYRLELR